MTSRVTIWKPYRSAIPIHSTLLPFDTIRANVFALAASQACGFAASWSYTNSVTRAEASPGTATLPLRKYWKKGTGNTTKWVKAICVYTGSNLTKVTLYYSDDNEASYVPMLDENDNYVLTLVYDGADVASTSWGNAP